MAEKKLFVNETSSTIDITLYIRERDHPTNNADIQTFRLESGEAKTVAYGDETNIFLNGIQISEVSELSAVQGINDEYTPKQDKLLSVKHGERLDDDLHSNNTVQIVSDGETFHVSPQTSYYFEPIDDENYSILK